MEKSPRKGSQRDKYLPLGQEPHSGEPAGEFVPFGHFLHALFDVAPVIFEKVPSLHSMQTSVPWAPWKGL